MATEISRNYLFKSNFKQKYRTPNSSTAAYSITTQKKSVRSTITINVLYQKLITTHTHTHIFKHI